MTRIPSTAAMRKGSVKEIVEIFHQRGVESKALSDVNEQPLSVLASKAYVIEFHAFKNILTHTLRNETFALALRFERRKNA